jgi:hypothetical protein
VVIPGLLSPEDVNKHRAHAFNIYAIGLRAISLEGLNGQREIETSNNFRRNKKFLENTRILRPPTSLQQPVF